MNEEKKPDSAKSKTAQREEEILAFWKENRIFEKSLSKKSPRGRYVFYDGPPFATGTPHYGHILGSTVKDVIGRYKTMRGYTVPRRWGWDCHGLPIENIVEKDLWISGRKEIEKLGIDKFVEHARSKVLTYVAEWKKTIERMARWVDFDNSYKTMDNSYIESVWWALGELHKKGLLYEGVRVLAYCPRCETPIANSEIAMDQSYKDIADISVYVKFRLKDEPETYLLAWTTTPWTLPGNTALAVNANLTYLKVVALDCGKKYIFAKNALERMKAKFTSKIEIVEEFSGKQLVEKTYEPVFLYYKNSEVAKDQNIWKVWHADFVTTDMGTGIAHEAPAFGEDDMLLAKEHGIPWISHVDETGRFKQEVLDFAGLQVKPKDTAEDPDAHLRTDIEVLKYLEKSGALFAKEKINHSYPHCYRCDTPLLYYALPSWFVNIQKAKGEILRTGKSINWVPSYLKNGRYKNILESAPDWTISRNRYWASPLPVWKSASGKIMFVNSIEDLKRKTKKSGNRYFVMRHGESESNLEGMISSYTVDSDHLTDRGVQQVRDVIGELSKRKIDLIISSDLARTRETAELIKRELRFSEENFFLDKKLREISTGVWDGKKWKDLKNFIEENKEERYLYKPENGESGIDVKLRVSEFLYDLETRYKNRNILIVTHEGPARMMLAGSAGMDNEATARALEDKKIPFVANGEVIELDFIPLPHNALYELDLHRPYIDSITLVDEEGTEYKRVPEVLDCWFESGSMPFAQDHFPFENPDWKKQNFPAGFVAEYIAQTRTWFYYMHVISSTLFGQAPFENVVTTGTVLAEDGRKMSKSKGNFPDPTLLFDKYGVDALRFYLMSCPVMKGEDINFSEKSVQEVANKIIGRLRNVLAFYLLYRDPSAETLVHPKPSRVLDKWVLYRLEETVVSVTNGMEAYNTVLASKPFDSFIEDLSVWYLRRSRERIKDGDREAKRTLHFVLRTLVRLLAPLTPFLAEDIWLAIRSGSPFGGTPKSVHLTDWPKVSLWLRFISKFNLDVNRRRILKNMKKVREVVSLGLEARQRAKIPVRQPLGRLKVGKMYADLRGEYLELIKDELHIKEVVHERNIHGNVLLSTEITPELKEEGVLRDLSRAVQEMRKEAGLTPKDQVSLLVETDAPGEELLRKFETGFLKTVSVSTINFRANDGKELKAGNLRFKFKIFR